MAPLEHLAECLRQELPAFSWNCRPKHGSRLLHNTNIPEEFEIEATHDGKPVPGSPWHLSGMMLHRWGVGPTARLVCREFVASQQKSDVAHWDKLAEL